MSVLLALISRDVRLTYGRGGVGLPIVFFLLVATLYPFGVGPDGPLLARTGGGVLWIAALLAALLPIDRLIAPDADQGVLDQLAVPADARSFASLGAAGRLKSGTPIGEPQGVFARWVDPSAEKSTDPSAKKK